jgi:hypothetical protein
VNFSMKHLMTIAATAVLVCGLTGARATAGDGCSTCGDACAKKSLFGGWFAKKSHGCGCDTCAAAPAPVVAPAPAPACDTCGTANACNTCGKKSHFNFSGWFSKKSCGCDIPASTCDSCAHKSYSIHQGSLWPKNLCCDEGAWAKDPCAKDSCAKKSWKPSFSFFKKKGCGCEAAPACDTCGGSTGTVISAPAPAASPAPALKPVPATPGSGS